MTRARAFEGRKPRCPELWLLGALALTAILTPAAHAATTNRYSTNDHGDFLIFGNTVGFDCRDGKVEKPIVGSVPIGLLGLFSCNGILPDMDSGVDIFWRSEFPGTGQATAAADIDPPSARATAILTLPAGAQVVMARLYWGAQRTGGLGAGTTVTFGRPGGSSRQVKADPAASATVSFGGLDYYQSSADVTADLQSLGNGAYRVSDIQTIDIRDVNLDVLYIAWNVVVVYHLDSAPVRNIVLYDGLNYISTGGTTTTNISLNGFVVPSNGFSAKLGVIGYEGDNDITGDSLMVNGTAISNAYNPANNFFNRTSTVLGQLAPQTGDLPQFSGRPSSMAGLDTDVVDITGQLKGGDTSMMVSATTSGDDYFLGALATAISTLGPIFSNTNKTVKNLTRNDGRFLPGDTLEYTISTTNTGNDPGTKVTVSDPLPQGITFVPGSITITSANGTAAQTDQSGDDEAEYTASSRTITARVGTGATATMGGTLTVGQSASVIFHATIDSGTQGVISNQAFVSSVGQTAGSQGGTPVTWPSGNGGTFNVPTPVTISTCTTNADCPATAPICDTTQMPPVCVCNADSDCPSGLFCDPGLKLCVECNPSSTGQCNANGAGGICLPNGSCGCMSDADCNGRMCNTATNTCQPNSTDLSLTLSRYPPGTTVPPGTDLVYTLTATNNGNAPISGATIDAAVSSQTAGAAWTCVGQNGAKCPAASGMGAIMNSVSLPAGGQLIYTMRATANSDPSSDSLDFNATITPPRDYIDTNPADNYVTDSVLIGMAASGPDLSLDVTETPSTTDSSITYALNVTNNGPGAAGGADVEYDVPPNSTVQIMAGDGWNCNLTADNMQVLCTRTQPIPQGPASPITLVVTAQPGTTQIPLKAGVTPTDANGNIVTDPDPSNNTVDRISMLNQFRLEGGGLVGCNCSLGQAPAQVPSGPFGLGISCLLGLGLLVRSQRRRAAKRNVMN